MVAPQPPDNAYRRLYYHLHKLVDQAIGRILDALEASGMADDTIIVFTSDHGDLLGAHGGLQQKWASAFDEATRVPMVIKGPGVSPVPGGITIPTSHVDLIPTLLGLAGVDPERAAAGLARNRYAHALIEAGSRLVIVSANERIVEQLAVTGITVLIGAESVYPGDERVGATLAPAQHDAQAWVEARR